MDYPRHAYLHSGCSFRPGPLHIGDPLACEQPVDFIEEEVKSIHPDNRNVYEAHVGDHVGLITGLTKQQARKGVNVYLARRSMAGK